MSTRKQHHKNHLYKDKEKDIRANTEYVVFGICNCGKLTETEYKSRQD